MPWLLWLGTIVVCLLLAALVFVVWWIWDDIERLDDEF